MGSLGLRYVGVAAGAAILLGGLGGLVALLAGRGRKSAIPFGPFLTAGALVAVFWGERIADLVPALLPRIDARTPVRTCGNFPSRDV